MTSGAIVVLSGPTNSGKSTLFNSLAGYDRAIVNQEPGTTRDLLEVMIIIDGVPITVVDTAGLRETANDIESEGIRRAEDYIKKADLVCIINDITQVSKSTQIVDNTLLENNRVVNIYNKIDLVTKENLNKYRDEFMGGLFTSAINGLGLDELKKHIVTTLDLENSTGELFGITTPRQYNAIIKSDAAIAAVSEIMNQAPIQLELISYELQSALRGIEELLGIKTADEILDRMFKSFCVGK
jgi:tRNA modification GTPase